MSAEALVLEAGGKHSLCLQCLTTKAVSLSASRTPLAATSTPQHSMASTPCEREGGRHGVHQLQP